MKYLTLILLVTCGALLVTRGCHTTNRRRLPPTRDFTGTLPIPRKGHGSLAAGAPISEKSTGVPSPPEPLDCYVWKQKALSSEPGIEEVEQVIEEGRAELLEPWLSAKCRRELDEATADVSETIREVASEYALQVRAVKKVLLATRPDRYIRITTVPPQDDPNYGQVLEKSAEVEGKTGAVWGDFDPLTGDLVYYVILWKEWPQLKSLLEGQVWMAVARTERVRDFARSAYERYGEAAFQQH